MSYGLKGKVKEIVRNLDAARNDKSKARNITLRQYLAEKYKDGSGNGLTPGHLYAELGIDPAVTNVETLYADDDNKYLMSEIVRDGILRGMGLAQREQMQMASAQRVQSQAPILAETNGERFISPQVFLDPVRTGAVQAIFYPDLVVREVSVPQPTVTIPRIDLSDAKMVDSEEGATIEEGTVKYGTKDVKVKKRAKGIKISYEAIQFNTLDLVQIYFQDMGRLLGAALNSDAVSTIINGDQLDGSEAAAVIGVTDTAKGVQYRDILRVWVRLAMLGRMSTSIIGNEETAGDYLDLPEVKNKQNIGNVLLPTMIKTPLPTEQDLYASIRVAPGQLVFQDSSMSLVQLTAMALLLETDKIISKQLAESYASIMTGFAKLQRNSSLIVDKTLAYSAAPFPAWMTPIQN